MKRIVALTAAFLLAIFMISCENDSPTNLVETVTFEVTAKDNDDTRYDPVCDPSLGIGNIYPVSIEFKPEIRIYSPNSTTFQVIDLPTNTASDPEYFGVTPCKNMDINDAPPCIPCCEDSLGSNCTPCIDDEGNPLTGNYRFTVTASGGKVVGIFQKKNYQEGFDPRDNAELTVHVCLNGQFMDTYTAITKEEGGAVTIIVPLD